MIVIDTSVAVDFLRGKERGLSVIEEHAKDSIGFAAISLFELLNPLHERKLVVQAKAVKAFVRQLNLLPFDADAAEESAVVMGSLKRIGQQVSPLDVMIVGTAMANGAAKVISLDKDFERIGRVSSMNIEVVE